MNLTHKTNGIFSLLLAFGFLSHGEALPKGGHSRSATRGNRASRYGRPILVIVPNPPVNFEGQKGIELNLTSEELSLETKCTEDEASVSKFSLSTKINLLSIICIAGAGVGVVLVFRVCAGWFIVKRAPKCQEHCNCDALIKSQQPLHENAGYQKICHVQSH